MFLSYFLNMASKLQLTFSIADVDELTGELAPCPTRPADSVSESMWPRRLHDSTCLFNIMNSLPAVRSGNAVLNAVTTSPFK